MGRQEATPRIAILGAGFAGIGMAMRLVRAGITSFTLYEKATDIGGTWRDNTYPGLSCDVPSYLYCFSFGPAASWSRRFPPQQEVLRYLRRCVESHGLRPHLRLGVEITAAEFDDDAGTWRLRCAEGADIEADVVVSGLGQLNRPRMPDLDGLEDFTGALFHSARWRHDHDLTGRTVTVLGSGASAAQFVPRIASQVEQLHLFQRTPSWVVPKDDHPHSPRFRRALERFRPLRWAYRAWLYWGRELFYLPMRWRLPSALATRWADNHRRTQVTSPDLRRRLAPDYPIGCKRIVLSDDFYPALERDNVELHTESVERITPDGLLTSSGAHVEADTIICGTGFRASEFLAPLRITGRDGRPLEDAWRDGAHAYLGMAVSGFPNLFLLYGPNTNLGHNSIILMLERQTAYVLRCLRRLTGQRGSGKGASLEVTEQAMAADDARTRRGIAGTVWTRGCTSWYQNAAGRVTNNWPHSTIRYWWRTLRPRPRDFRLRSHRPHRAPIAEP